MGADFLFKGAHSHFIPAVSDGDGDGAGLSRLREEKGGIRDHVVDDFAAHVVVVAVGGFSRPLKAYEVGGGKIPDAASYKSVGSRFRQDQKPCLRRAKIQGGL